MIHSPCLARSTWALQSLCLTVFTPRALNAFTRRLQLQPIIIGATWTWVLRVVLGTIQAVVSSWAWYWVLHPMGALGVILEGAVTIVALGTELTR